jgi:preprotein translocase subunit SecG
MVILLTLVHIAICIFLVIVVLLQSGKAADLAAAFGGMGSQTAFGPRGSASVLSKATTIAAALFMVTSLSLSILATRSAGAATSVVERSTGKPASTAPKSAPPPAAPVTQPNGIKVTPMTNGVPGKTQTVPLPPPPAKTPTKK